MKQRTENSSFYRDDSRQAEIISRFKSNNDMLFMTSGKKRLAFIQTFGCQQNEADSEAIAGMLEEMGFDFTDNREVADIIIFNTCCVRENAELKLLGNIGALKHLKQNNPELILIVCGCMMQQEHIVQLIRSKYKHVDIIFGTHSLHRLPEMLDEAIKNRNIVVNIDDCEGHIIEGYPIRRKDISKAWVSIMYGCNNFCSYCIVPYVRGRERSRRPEDIIEEIEGLARRGFKEVTLLGQNVNSYGKDLHQEMDFTDLITDINKIDGISRIRFMTSHPKDISDKLIDAIARCENVCKHLHLPVQSGSNKVLNDMNRGYSREGYLEIVDKLRSRVPGIALTTDIIVGFPTETNDDFQDTLDLVEKVKFDSIFTFIYSKRKGTVAEKLEPALDVQQIKHNFDRLVELQNDISAKINNSYVGKTVEVLVEGESKTNPKVFTGRTETTKVVNFEATKQLVGNLVNIEITDAQTWSLTGRIVGN